MIKKIFSFRSKHGVRAALYTQSCESAQGLDLAQPHQQLQTKQLDLKTTIENRGVFRIDYWNYKLELLRQSVYSCCCGLVCCFKKYKSSREQRHYQIGTRKLYNEIDLLELVKTMRVSRFLASLYMTNSQKELVKFLHAYCLNSSK